MEHIIKVTTTGSAGSAAGSGSTEDLVRGFIEWIKVDYHASAPNTTDLTLGEADGPTRTVLTLGNTSTDKVAYPRVLLQDTSGADLTAIYGRIYVSGRKLTATLAQCDALTDAVVITILVSEY